MGDWLNNILSEPVAITTLILALITAVLAGTSFWIIQQNYKFKEKDRKERLLDEIIQWATEINTVSLKTELPRIDPSLELAIEEKAKGNQETIEGTKRNIVNKEHFRITVETLFRYSIPISKAVYIKALASKNFPRLRLTKILDDIIDTLPALEFLISKQIGISIKEGFGPSVIAIMMRVEQELKDPGNAPDSLFNKYATQLSHSVDDLYTEAANIISK